jgi:hypothetical protein
MLLRIGLILLDIVLVMIFNMTLQRAIGRKSAGRVGFLFLGMRQMKVSLKGSGLSPLLRMLRIVLVMSSPIVSQ